MCFENADVPMTEEQKAEYDKIMRERGEIYAWYYRMTLLHAGEKYRLRVRHDLCGSLDLYLWRTIEHRSDGDRYIYFCQDYDELKMAMKHFEVAYGIETWRAAILDESTEKCLCNLPMFTHKGMFTEEELQRKKRAIDEKRWREYEKEEREEEEQERKKKRKKKGKTSKKDGGLVNWFKGLFNKKSSWGRGEKPPIV